MSDTTLKQNEHDLTIIAVSLFESWKERKWDMGKDLEKKQKIQKFMHAQISILVKFLFMT